ncbi:hypothetical protein SY2F82_69800 [Streptomyces sp. Y2F8-2]|uniref:hypothetical protein n=1 Tax=unclassified Streptomyces TaxID=2593676 RepID=UPI0019052037|nr:hypothetical protein [Streptomyces sp. Y2F8-2]GHK05183.1 hypothetical protein SY2F82_69800 [Streptomyces sp. Y2F8-2]
MIAVALLMPVSMLCLMLALGSYEERLLTPGGTRKARGAGRRRLRAVPRSSQDGAVGADGAATGSRVRERPTAQKAGDTRAAGSTVPDGSGARWRAA